MRVAARVLVLGLAIGVLGAADARAPELNGAPTGLAGVPGPQSLGSLSIGPAREEQALVRIDAEVPPAPAAVESTPDFWLLGGVCIGLVAYQLRRKHRLLRPQPFQLRPDL
ncbi:MAG: hypothetical protein ABW034_11445 [Steroidobacteraceae bacterium]